MGAFEAAAASAAAAALGPCPVVSLAYALWSLAAVVVRPGPSQSGLQRPCWGYSIGKKEINYSDRDAVFIKKDTKNW
jgi:hypothetical protein